MGEINIKDSIKKEKDWVGNRKSTFVTLGASNHTDRERAEYDLYCTSPSAIDALAKVGKLPKNKNVWECAAGLLHLSNRLRDYGYSVISTDLIDRGTCEGGIDFLETKELRAPCILTNPPYKYCLEFVEHAVHTLQCDEYYGFHKLTFLESVKRRAFFDKYPPAEVLVFSKRINVATNGDPEMFEKSSAACYAWFIWRKGIYEAPKVGWI